MDNKKFKIKIDQKYADEDSESSIIREKEHFKGMNLFNLKENPFKIKQKTEQKSILDSENKVIYKESKKSVKINTEMKSDNLMDCLHLLQFIDKDPNYSDSGYGARKTIKYDLNDITLDFLNSDQKREEFTFTDLESSRIPELLYFYIEIGQFFSKQSKFMKKNKLFTQTIGLSRRMMDEYKKLILEKIETINDIMELQDALVAEINKEAELLDSNYTKNKEKKNQDLLNDKLNSNFAKKGINGLNNALEQKIQENSNLKIYNYNSFLLNY